MILEFLNMGGYGLYIWLSYAFAALSLISLYYVSVKKLNFSYKITPKGIRIPVCSVKGSCPRPLDDGGIN